MKVIGEPAQLKAFINHIEKTLGTEYFILMKSRVRENSEDTNVHQFLDIVPSNLMWQFVKGIEDH